MQSTPYKIIFYTDTPLYGGAENQMYLLAKYLDPKYFEPIFVFRKLETLDLLAKKLQELNIKTFLIPSKSKHSLKNFTFLNKVIHQEKPALLHAHIWNPMASKYAFPAKALTSIPLVITEHDPFHLPFPKNLYKKFTLNFADAIITVSEANQQLINQLYPKQRHKTVTIHNGIEELPKPILETRRHTIRKEIFQVGPETQVIFSAGTLHERKGYKYLISAYRKILQKFPNSKLIIAGEGPERAALEKLIKNLDLGKRVMLLGQSNNIPELLASANLFVLPSLKEAFGLAILEAMQAGLPVVASQVGGIPEILDKNLGIMVEPANKNELIKAISKLLSHPELMKKMGQHGKKRSEEFSAQKTANETSKLYLQIITTHHAS